MTKMFTGVIHHIGTITEAKKDGDLTITVASDLQDFRIGESIACNGACLTVTAFDTKSFTTQLSDETLRCTSPRWNIGDKLHLERAMRLGDALDGHIVSGHVDGLATLKKIESSNGSHVLTLEAPVHLSKFIAEKGSITLDGVSLTVNTVQETQFTVNIIPHTWQATTLHKRKSGDNLNLEIDIIARYIARLNSVL